MKKLSTDQMKQILNGPRLTYKEATKTKEEIKQEMRSLMSDLIIGIEFEVGYESTISQFATRTMDELDTLIDDL